MLDPRDQMKCVSVGAGGVWAVKAKDDSIWVRMHERLGKQIGKVDWNSGKTGEGWLRVTVKEDKVNIFFV